MPWCHTVYASLYIDVLPIKVPKKKSQFSMLSCICNPLTGDTVYMWQKWHQYLSQIQGQSQRQINWQTEDEVMKDAVAVTVGGEIMSL